MKVIFKGRQEGVTTSFVNWLKEDPETRAIIVHNLQTATNLRNEFNLSWIDVVPYANIGKLQGTSKKYFALDEYQLFFNTKEKDIPEGTVYISITTS
jgi:hypothetical protein